MNKILGTERLFYDTATKIVYEKMPDGTYNPISIGGAGHVRETPASGVARNRHASRVTGGAVVAGGDVQYVSPGVSKIAITHVWVVSGIPSAALIDWGVRVAFAAPSDATALVWLPATRVVANNSDIGNVVEFTVEPIYGDSDATPVVAGIAIKGGIFQIPTEKISGVDGVLRLDFMHNLGITLGMTIEAIEEV